MAVRISSTRNRTTRVEPLGPALVLFERGIADLEGDVRPGVLEAARRKRYRISDDDPTTPAPKVIRRRKPASNTPPAEQPATEQPTPVEPALDPAPPTTGQAEGADVDDELVDEQPASDPA